MIDLGPYLDRLAKAFQWSSSALAPLLWLNALVTLPLIVISYLVADQMRWGYFALAVGVIVFTLVQYRELRKTDPRLLRSESFQLEMQKLDIVQQKGGPIIIDSVSLPIAESQRPQQLPERNRPAHEEGTPR